MVQHNDEPGSATWLQRRFATDNASDAPAMMGCNPHESRNDLLLRLHTGLQKEFSDYQQKRVIDPGHGFEHLARPLGEAILGEDLYPIGGSVVVDGLAKPMGASYDGLTMAGDIVWEHKRLNEELRAALPATGPEGLEKNDGKNLPLMYRTQVEQQLMVSGATRALFTASEWEIDRSTGEWFCKDVRHCWYHPDGALRAELVAGWKQLEADQATFSPPEVVDVIPIVARQPNQLPALRSVVRGELVLESNLREWEDAALAYIKSVREHELKTDDDFANADAAADWCKASKEQLQGVRANLMAATGDVNTAVGTLDRIIDELDKTRINFSNAIDARKTEMKRHILTAGTTALQKHVEALNVRLGGQLMPVAYASADFPGAVKGKSSLVRMKNAIDEVLARAKIAANQVYDRIEANQKYLAEHAADYPELFPDKVALLAKAADDFQAQVTARVAKHREAENQRKAKDVTTAPAAAPATAAPVAEPDPFTAPTVDVTSIGSQTREVVQAPAVVQMQPRAQPTMKLGDINALLAPLAITAEGLRTLGFEPAKKERSAVLFHEQDLPRIVEACVLHLQAALRQRKAA